MNSKTPTNRPPWPDRPLFMVDDDEHWLAMMTQALKSLGWHNLRTLSDPSYAVQLATEFKPAAVLLDLMMAEKDGRQILRELHREQPQLPIIVITGLDQIETAVSCMSEGASDYLNKPLKREDLERALRRATVDESERKNGNGPDFNEVLSEIDELPNIKEVPDMLIEEALRRSGGVVKDAAAMLGISSQAICNRRRRANQIAN